MVFSPSALKSTTPRSERPIRRWISTVRPSGRPLETSRCLRSPVDAGSIPYSEVTQPRPWPDRHLRDVAQRQLAGARGQLAGAVDVAGGQKAVGGLALARVGQVARAE